MNAKILKYDYEHKQKPSNLNLRVFAYTKQIF